MKIWVLQSRKQTPKMRRDVEKQQELPQILLDTIVEIMIEARMK
jgi:hypothetical protein